MPIIRAREIRFLLLPLLAWATGASAIDLAGYTIGAEMTQAQRTSFAKGQGNFCDPTYCQGEIVLGAIPARILIFLDPASKIEVVKVSSYGELKDSLYEAAVEKFGAPTSRRSTPALVANWKFKEGEVAINDRCGPPGIGAVCVIAKSKTFRPVAPKAKL